MSPAAEQQKYVHYLLFSIGATALTLVLLVATGSLGVAGFLLVALIAVPAAYVHMRFGTAAATTTVVLVAFGSHLLDGMTGSIGYLLQFGLVALILPYLLRRGWPWARSVAVSVAFIVLVSYLFLAGYAGMIDSTVSGQIDSFADTQVEQAMALYANSDLKPEQVDELRSAAEQMADYLRYAYFGAAVTITGLLAMLLLWLLSVAARGDYRIPVAGFQDWKAPEMLVWALIAAGFISYFAAGDLRQAAVNLLIILLPVYFIQGFAIVVNFLNRRQIPPIMRGCAYVLIAFFNPLPIIVTGIGVFDLWVDFRKPRVKTT
ncbi:MAG: hypothetical protein C0623_05840 [Desulfuromonas sp.]|nr:MAG: hypothetical protein C0623_05840 [Desulfuromonas sp.]